MLPLRGANQFASPTGNAAQNVSAKIEEEPPVGE